MNFKFSEAGLSVAMENSTALVVGDSMPERNDPWLQLIMEDTGAGD
jgi:hypothetical protein